MNSILDFTDETRSVCIKNGQFIIERRDGQTCSIHPEEIAMVILSGHCINLTRNVLEQLLNNGGSAIVCDSSKMPIGILSPIIGHHLQSRYMKEQATASLPLQKRLWKQIICAKIEGQGKNLLAIYGKDFALGQMSAQVKTGDATNIEGRAARRYWSKLFSIPQFKRDCDGQDVVNAALNYGYAILRSLTARAIAASGLNPSLGLFHHNKYNAFCLADDLMEPFRPVVDNAVWHLWHEKRLGEGITPDVKRSLIESIIGKYRFDNGMLSVFDALTRVSSSLADAFCGIRKDLCLPGLELTAKA